MTMLAETVDLVIGVDTHKHTHTAALVTSTGALLEERTVTTDPRGYAELLELACARGTHRAWAIEGTGSYGAGLTRFLEERGEQVIELDRPWRAKRRDGAKSDSIDAARAARDALSRTKLSAPRSGAQRAGLAVLLATRRSAVKASADAQRQLQAFVVAAPEALAAMFRGRSGVQMLRVATGLRIDPSWDPETLATATVLSSLAHRVLELTAEAEAHKRAISALVRSLRPELLKVTGVGPIVAATILCAWSHPGRCRSEAAFAKLAGVSPIEASSGQTTRHRLNRYGDRQLNRALHTVVLTRLRCHDATRAYVVRRRSEGKSDREIKRCLKRYVSREIYRLLEQGPKGLDAT